jgi:hypothetical protein
MAQRASGPKRPGLARVAHPKAPGVARADVALDDLALVTSEQPDITTARSR